MGSDLQWVLPSLSQEARVAGVLTFSFAAGETWNGLRSPRGAGRRHGVGPAGGVGE